jgi:hypothetical protein
MIEFYHQGADQVKYIEISNIQLSVNLIPNISQDLNFIHL